MDQTWVQRWKYWIAQAPVKPGVWRMKGGGHYVRGRAVDPRTGRMREVSMPLPDADAGEAYRRLQAELDRVREGHMERVTARVRFSEFAASLMEKKVLRGDLASAKTRVTWAVVLEQHLLPAFGDMFLDAIGRADIEDWQMTIAKRVRRAEYSPVTGNGWLAILRVILNAAVIEHDLPRNPMLGIRPFDTSTHNPYTDEEPNSLTPAEVPTFLAEMRRQVPQHFAMTALGFATGLRPSSLRPLRRAGATPDVLWDDGILLVRRSHTVGDEVMDSTKTKRRQRLSLPTELIDILRWHAEQLPPGPMHDSELLFPSDLGGFRSSTVLDKPFKAVGKAIGLRKKFTPRGMRRTFQDLCRAAHVADLVARAVSGHATDTMQQHYSTVTGDEMRQNLARVISLAGFRDAMARAEPAESQASETEVVGKVVGSPADALRGA